MLRGAAGISGHKRRWIGLSVLLAVACGVFVAGAAAHDSRELHHVMATKRPKVPHGVTLSTRQVILALAREGVGVYRSPGATTPMTPVTAPAVPIEVLYPQAVLYADQTKHHSGTLGASLNQVMPALSAPAGQLYPKFDYLMAAYAASTATPGEVLAGRLLGHVDLTHPDAVVFPDLIETLLSADALRAAAQGSTAAQGDFAAAGAPPVASAANAGSSCSTLADWVSHAYNSVFNALTVGASSNSALDLIGQLWNKAVSLAQSAISNVASALTGPVIAAIRTGLATAGVVSWVVSTLRNLQVTVSADPSYNSFGIEPGHGKKGKVTITVGKPSGWDWPSGIPECAQLLHVTLPSVNSVVGRTVQWKTVDVNSVPTDSWCEPGHACYLAKQESAESSLQSNHTASLTYRTNTETHFQATHGIPIDTDSILVSGTVGLNTDQLVKLIKDVLLDAVPGGAAKIVTGPLFDTLTAALQGQLAKLSQPKFFRYVLVEHHGNSTLPARGCESLDMSSDFPPPPLPGNWAPDYVAESGTASMPGLTEGTGCSVTTYAPGGGYQCSATVNCQPLGFWDLFYFSSDAYAEDGFTTIVKDGLFDGSTPVDVGDEGADNTVGGVVRVENAVFYFRFLPKWSNDPAPEQVLEDAVEKICPDCTFSH